MLRSSWRRAVIHRIPQLTLSPETAFFVVLKAREFHMKVEEVDPDEGSNPTDDGNVDVLEFNPGDAVQEELVSAIDGLNEDERLDLIALIWIGRGDFTLSDWREARENARRIDPSQVATYVLGLTRRSATIWRTRWPSSASCFPATSTIWRPNCRHPPSSRSAESARRESLRYNWPDGVDSVMAVYTEALTAKRCELEPSQRAKAR
jgi:hypothetical protein